MDINEESTYLLFGIMIRLQLLFSINISPY